MKYAPNLRRHIFAGFLLSFLILGGALIVIQREIIRDYLIESRLKYHTVIGNNIIKDLSTRLMIAEATATSVVNAARVMPKEPELFRQIIPALLNKQGYEFLIAGGGYWPEPNEFVPGVERHSFFWGRQQDGALKYFDDYNLPEGNGYHREEWYVPARYGTDKKCYWSRSYVDPYSGQPMVTCTIPALAGERFVGVSTVDFKLEGLGELMEAAIGGVGGYGFIVDRNNKFIYHPDETGVLQGGDPESPAAKEKIDAAVYAEKVPEFAAYRDVLNGINKSIVEKHQAFLAQNPQAQQQKIESELTARSYQINADEAKVIFAMLSAYAGASVVGHDLEPVRNEYLNDHILKQPVYVDTFFMPETFWKIVLVTPQSNIIAKANESFFVLLRYTVEIIVACFLLFFFVLHQILFKPVRNISMTIKASSADGKGEPLNQDVNNELGEIAYWYNLRTRDMVEARKSAEEANKTKSTFLANMSHELRTPLNSIIGMCQMMDRKALRVDMQEMFDSIHKSSKILLSIVNDILDLSKIEAKEYKLEYLLFDVAQVMKDSIQSMMPLAMEKGLILTYDGPDTPVPIMGDKLRFTRILSNIVSNAIRYTLEGSVKVSARVQTLADGQTMIRCEVIDTGIGIPKDKQGKIFEKFTQADASITRKFGGTGLGLAITKELVELMNGRIGFESEEGRGSTFWFEISFDAASVDDLARTEEIIKSQSGSRGVPAKPCVPAGKAKILVAEDHDMNQLLIRKILGSIGVADCTLVENGKEVVKAVAENDFDLVLMDCHMPEMNGYDATVAIRALPDVRRRAVPIIALTASMMKEDEARCLSVGMNAYVGKPIDITVLKEKMAGWIDFSNGAAVPEEKAKSSAAQEPALVNLSRFRESGITDDSVIREFVQVFLSVSPDHIRQLKEHAVGGESPQWCEIAHMLKGAAASLGAEQLAQLCEKAEKTLEATDSERQSQVAAIEAAFARVREEFIRLGLHS